MSYTPPSDDRAGYTPSTEMPNSPDGASPVVSDPLLTDTDGPVLPPLVGRDMPLATLVETITHSPFTVVFLSGSHGSGKTLLLRHTLAALQSDIPTCYVFCRRHDSEYAVLRQFYQALIGDDPGTGYHTGRLERMVTAAVTETDTAPVLVCDDLGFLLQADGLDLLYFLSRLETPLRLVLASANLPDPQLTLGARTYSSLQPHHVSLDPYTVSQAVDILQGRTKQVTGVPLPDDVARDMAKITTNVRVGLHWIARVHDVMADDESLATALFCRYQQDAVNRYRRDLLAPFTVHHHLLLAAVRDAVVADANAYTGDIYERYQRLCRFHSQQPLTPRHTSTFLNHLELLDLIDVTYHRGGETGKTRAVKLVSIEDL